jgi:2-polyprenyl-3-methyl-5-hydroxy-6-metoxy-1,4-benzoquinol methylase
VEITNYCLHEKVKYIGKNLETCEGKEYDIILLIAVLEHMNKPLEFIAILQKYLSKKGIIIVAVPNSCNHEWKIMREPLTHCNYFGQESLERLTEIIGLKTLEIKVFPFPKFKGQEAIGQIFYIGKR